ncbi:MAG: hypothetical protein JRJ69_18150 [Deltaproteobacteria bacterium]|nr:hypothetical protein [Deltaproteobacteria bacterium]
MPENSILREKIAVFLGCMFNNIKQLARSDPNQHTDEKTYVEIPFIQQLKGKRWRRKDG